MFTSSEPVILILARLLLKLVEISTSTTTSVWAMKQYEKCQEYLMKEVE